MAKPMIECSGAFTDTLQARRPATAGDACGTWPLRIAPQLSQVRAAVQELAIRRYAHPSIVAPERSLVDVMERLALVVSELGGNALRHAQAPIVVQLSRLRHGWIVDVTDGGPDMPARAHEWADGDGERSHGLDVVAQVSDDVGWWIDSSAGAKHVWALVPDLPPPGLQRRLSPI